jgi:hypothetical protein
MKVTIKRWNAVATWRWEVPEDEVCGICRVQFDGTCPSCKFPGDDCTLCMTLTCVVDKWLTRISDGQMWSFISHGAHFLPFDITTLIEISTAFLHGSSKTQPKVSVPCADRVRESDC